MQGLHGFCRSHLIFLRLHSERGLIEYEKGTVSHTCTTECLSTSFAFGGLVPAPFAGGMVFRIVVVVYILQVLIPPVRSHVEMWYTWRISDLCGIGRIPMRRWIMMRCPGWLPLAWMHVHVLDTGEGWSTVEQGFLMKFNVDPKIKVNNGG
jgi:hypothetical protein